MQNERVQKRTNNLYLKNKRTDSMRWPASKVLSNTQFLNIIQLQGDCSSVVKNIYTCTWGLSLPQYPLYQQKYITEVFQKNTLVYWSSNYAGLSKGLRSDEKEDIAYCFMSCYSASACTFPSVSGSDLFPGWSTTFTGLTSRD